MVFGASEGVRSIARGNFNGFEGFFGPKEGFYVLRRWKSGQNRWSLYMWRENYAKEWVLVHLEDS